MTDPWFPPEPTEGQSDLDVALAAWLNENLSARLGGNATGAEVHWDDLFIKITVNGVRTWAVGADGSRAMRSDMDHWDKPGAWKPVCSPIDEIESLRREARRLAEVGDGLLARADQLAHANHVEGAEDPPCPGCGGVLTPMSIEDGEELADGRWVGSASAACRSCGWRGQLEWPWVPEEQEGP